MLTAVAYLHHHKRAGCFKLVCHPHLSECVLCSVVQDRSSPLDGNCGIQERLVASSMEWQDSQPRIAHRDIKPGNLLLEDPSAPMTLPLDSKSSQPLVCRGSYRVIHTCCFTGTGVRLLLSCLLEVRGPPFFNYLCGVRHPAWDSGRWFPSLPFLVSIAALKGVSYAKTFDIATSSVLLV